MSSRRYIQSTGIQPKRAFLELDEIACFAVTFARSNDQEKAGAPHLIWG